MFLWKWIDSIPELMGYNEKSAKRKVQSTKHLHKKGNTSLMQFNNIYKNTRTKKSKQIQEDHMAKNNEMSVEINGIK